MAFLEVCLASSRRSAPVALHSKAPALCDRCSFSYFCSCTGLFWKGLSRISRKGWWWDVEGWEGWWGSGWEKNKNAALPLVAAVAAETPQRKWRIGCTLIQFTINQTLLDAGPSEHAALPYASLFRYAAVPSQRMRAATSTRIPVWDPWRQTANNCKNLATTEAFGIFPPRGIGTPNKRTTII